MATDIDVLAIRGRLGRHLWGVPQEFGTAEEFGGWLLDLKHGPTTVTEGGLTVPIEARIIISQGPQPDREMEPALDPWVHASMSRSDQAPTYQDMKRLHAAVWPTGWAYSVWAPSEGHVNLHETTLHLWGRPDGRKCLPNFGAMGTI